MTLESPVYFRSFTDLFEVIAAAKKKHVINAILFRDNFQVG
jgi:hypothetical protein